MTDPDRRAEWWQRQVNLIAEFRLEQDQREIRRVRSPRPAPPHLPEHQTSSRQVREAAADAGVEVDL